MKKLLLVFLMALPCFGQAPVIGGSGGVTQSSQLQNDAGYLLPSDPNLAAYYEALDNCQNAPMEVVIIGTSIERGQGASSYANSWAGKLTSALQAKCGNHGIGIIPVNNAPVTSNTSPYSTSGGTWAFTASLGFVNGGNSTGEVYQGSGSGVLTLSSQTADRFNIYYWTGSDTGSGFTVKIDGTAVGGTYGNSTSGSYTPHVVTVSAPSLGSHSIAITAPASGNVYINGIEPVIGTTGVTVTNLARDASDSTWFGANPTTEDGMIQVIPGLSLVIIGGPVNDYEANPQFVPATYQSYLQAFINYLQTTITNPPSVMLVDEPDLNILQSPYWPNGTGSGITYKRSAYTSLEKSTAASYGAAYVSIMERWGTWTNANARGLMTDWAHPNDKGHADFGAMMAQRLIGYQTPLVTSGSGVPSGSCGLSSAMYEYTGYSAVANTYPVYACTQGSWQGLALATFNYGTVYLNTVFNEGANGAAINGTSPATETNTGATWTTVSGTAVYSTGNGAAISGGGTITIPTAQTNYVMRATVAGIGTSNNGSTWLRVRVTDGSNFIMVSYATNDFSIWTWVSGSPTQLAGGSATMPSSGTIMVTVNGNNIQAASNGVTISATTTSNSAGTSVGVTQNGATGTLYSSALKVSQY